MPTVSEVQKLSAVHHAQTVKWRAQARAVHYQRIQGLLHSNRFATTGFDFIPLAGLPDEFFRLETRSLVVERKGDIYSKSYLSVTAKGTK